MDAILDLEYIALYPDGTIGVSDGVGYVGTLERDEVLSLFEAMLNLFPKHDDRIESALQYIRLSQQNGIGSLPLSEVYSILGGQNEMP